jgi:hypothetical protein
MEQGHCWEMSNRSDVQYMPCLYNTQGSLTDHTDRLLDPVINHKIQQLQLH